MKGRSYGMYEILQDNGTVPEVAAVFDRLEHLLLTVQEIATFSGPASFHVRNQETGDLYEVTCGADLVLTFRLLDLGVEDPLPADNSEAVVMERGRLSRSTRFRRTGIVVPFAVRRALDSVGS